MGHGEQILTQRQVCLCVSASKFGFAGLRVGTGCLGHGCRKLILRQQQGGGPSLLQRWQGGSPQSELVSAGLTDRPQHLLSHHSNWPNWELAAAGFCFSRQATGDTEHNAHISTI